MPGLLAAVKRFAEVTTLHGIKDLFSTDSRTIRVVWAVLLIATTGVMIYETERIVETFFDEPIATNLRLQKMTRHNLANIITPYVCLYDWISKSRAFNMYSEEEIWALDAFSNAQTVQYIYSKHFNATKRQLIRELIRYYQDEMLYKNKTLEDYYKPIMKNFSFLPAREDQRFRLKYLIQADSVCFPINLDAATDVVGVPIYRQALDLLPNDTIDYLAEAHLKKEVTFTFYQGANARYFSEIDRVIANFTVYESPSQLNLRMRFKKLVHLTRRTLKCKDHHREDAKSKYPVNYARQLCMQKCMDDEIYTQKYNCTFMVPKTEAQKKLITMEHKRDYPLCTAEKFFFSNKFTLNDTRKVTKCQDSCEDLLAFCSEWDIQNERIRWVAPRTCTTTGCLNLAIVAQPTLEVSEEVLLMSFDTLLSNIGGQAGLWFGGSILSVVQLLFFCFLYGTCKCSKRQRKKSSALVVDNRKCGLSDPNMNISIKDAPNQNLQLINETNDITDARNPYFPDCCTPNDFFRNIP